MKNYDIYFSIFECYIFYNIFIIKPLLNKSRVWLLLHYSYNMFDYYFIIHTTCLIIASLFIHVWLLLHDSYTVFGYCFVIYTTCFVIASLFIHHVWLLLHYSYTMFGYCFIIHTTCLIIWFSLTMLYVTCYTTPV